VRKVEVKLPVFPSGRFTVRSVMTGKSLGAYSGDQFKRGVSVELPPDYKVEVLEVRGEK